MYGQLRQFHAGLSLIGTPTEIAWGVLTRAALDDMHPDRRQVIDYLLANSGTHATAAIAGHCGLLPTTTRRHLEDLVAQRVLDLVGDNLERWCSSEWLHGYWPAGVG